MCPTVAFSHLQGFDAILVDYLHERKFPILGSISTWLLRLFSVGTLYGLYEFNTNDIGELQRNAISNAGY